MSGLKHCGCSVARKVAFRFHEFHDLLHGTSLHYSITHQLSPLIEQLPTGALLGTRRRHGLTTTRMRRLLRVIVVCDRFAVRLNVGGVEIFAEEDIAAEGAAEGCRGFKTRTGGLNGHRMLVAGLEIFESKSG